MRNEMCRVIELNSSCAKKNAIVVHLMVIANWYIIKICRFIIRLLTQKVDCTICLYGTNIVILLNEP